VDNPQEPRWLTEEEEQAWRALVWVMEWLPAAVDEQLQRDCAISHFEYGVMSALSEAPDRTMRISELAALANGSLTRMSRVIDRLHGRGWVCRRPDPSNGRYTLAVLTETGWEKVVASAPGHVAEVRRLVIDGLTKRQIGQLHEIGTRLQRTLRDRR
jgi:DNA-binding MarR family transcriptional regulator